MRLQDLFSKINGVYMAHMYYGDPSEDFSLKAMKLICDHGVDIIEFGVPFSDPNADGPVFQRACHRALKEGMTPEKAIQGIEKLRRNGLQQPIVVTSYYNPILQMGVDRFVKDIRNVGADALIVPNVPFEEADLLLDAGKTHNINIIFLVAPTTPEQRLKKIIHRAQGFLYVVTVRGVTGVRDSLLESTLELVRRVRKHTDIPLMGGFGISTRDHARAVVEAGANGVITGSVIGKIYENNIENPEKAFPEITRVVREIKEGCLEGVIKQKKGGRSL
jgi:tryptophan synthase alpha chain